MHVIGLTGGIASGKSYASAVLRLLGAEVVDADQIARALTLPGGDAAPAVISRFGTLDRKALGAIIFSDEVARRDLNAIVHPLVDLAIQRRIAESKAALIVLDVPLLFESGMERIADEVWVVHVPKEEQVRRVMERDKLTRGEALLRIESQMPTAEKLARANAAIDTSGTFEETRALIEALWQAAVSQHTHEGKAGHG